MHKTLLILASIFLSINSYAAENIQITSQTIEENNQQLNYNVVVHYPVISNSKLNSGGLQFNQAAKKWAEENVQKFKKEVSESNDASLPPELKDQKNALEITYDATTLEPQRAISVRFKIYTYFAGAAHPNQKFAALNYDLIHNKRLTLSDLFKPNSNYLSKIAHTATAQVTEHLNKEAGDKVDLFKEGLTPTADNYKVWNLLPEGIRFTFDPYQVAAYVFGPQEVLIPYADIKTYLANKPLDCLPKQTCQFENQKI